LDRQVHEDSSASLHEVIGDDHGEMEPSRVTELFAVNQQLNYAIDQLEPEMQAVLIYRFGLRGEDSHTLDQVAEQLNIHRERVRLVCKKALTALKRHLKRDGSNFIDLNFDD
jgi:RNA polymerase nonessential primary-like sigma factor